MAPADGEGEQPLAAVPGSPHRLVYLGSPEVAVPPLRALHEAGFELVGVVSAPDRRRARRAPATPTPVKAAALDLGLPVTTNVEELAGQPADLGVVVAYGRLIPRRVLERLPMVNLHFSLLPRWRGAAPVERAILAGDSRTGVCLMQLEEGLDTGPIFSSVEIQIQPEEQLSELRERLVTAGTELLISTLQAGMGEPWPQEGEPTYAHKLEPSELELNWEEPTEQLHRLTRLERAWTTFRGARIGVTRARVGPSQVGLGPGELSGTLVGTADGTLELLEVKPEGRRAQPAEDWVRGARPEPGERLGG